MDRCPSASAQTAVLYCGGTASTSYLEAVISKWRLYHWSGIVISPLHHLPQLCFAVCGRVRRDLLEFLLALHSQNPEVRHRLQCREAGNRSESHHCCSRLADRIERPHLPDRH